MNKTKNRIAAIAIAIFLMLSMSASMMLVPSASAHTPAWQIPTYAYIWATPNPDGTGQTVSVYMWLTNYYYDASTGGLGVPANNLRFHNYELTITAPNGAVTTQSFPIITDTTSNQHTSFVPNQVGTYNLTFTYPGETYVGPAPYTGDVFLPSSASTTVTVQSTPIANALTGAPLPTAYWTRPIYGENTGWYTISSNWLGTQWYPYAGDIGASGQNFFPGDAVGPLTSHIMWTKPLQSGGVVGGNQMAIQGQTYFDGSAYINRYINPIIMDGMIYYTEPLSYNGAPNSLTGSGVNGPTDCVNLQTGQTIWSSPNVPPLSFGILLDVQTPNEHGVCPPLLISNTWYLGTWQVYDGDTGTLLCTVNNVPEAPGYGPGFSSAPVIGPDGTYISYVFANAGTAANPDWTLGEWNSSRVFLPTGAFSPILSGTINGAISTGPDTTYDWNVSLPWLNTMTTPINPALQVYNTPWLPTEIANTPIMVIGANYGDGMLCINGTPPSNGENDIYSYVSSAPYTFFFINLNASRGAIGSVLWWSTLQPPPDNYTVVPGNVDWNTRMFFLSYKENVQWLGYSLTTGKYVWTAPPQAALDYYGNPGSGTLTDQIAYGNLYSGGYAGIIYCYNDTTGALDWTYGNGGAGNSTNAGLNYPYGDYPTFINAVGDGVLYLVTTAHTWTTPIYKGAEARAINATTGKEIWTLSGITAEFVATSYAIADGYATWFNGYDNQIYVVGRGPSATTVTAPDIGVTTATPITITGTVLDISAGTKQTEQAADFPYGVPCASEASMSAWMSYVYQQQPEPTNFTGVPVTLTETDHNGNTYTIGTTTTDESGTFAYYWTPPIVGNYTIVATFAGNNGYYGSCAETHVYASSPAATPAPTASPPTGLASTGTVELGVAVLAIIIIVCVAVLAVLMLRKRP